MANSTISVNVSPQELQRAAQGWLMCAAQPTGPKRMIVSTQARDKSGKTHFGFTMPGPIAFLNLDRGWEGVLDKFVTAGKVIVRKDFVVPLTQKMTDSGWDQLWAQLEASYLYAVTSGHFRSVFVDTGSAMWEALRMAEFGKLSKIPPMKYGEVNGRFEALILTALDYPVNVCIANRMKPVYAEGVAGGMASKTGTWEPSGYAQLPYIVQVSIEQAWNEEKNCAALRICRSRFDQRKAGTVLEGSMCDFPTLGMYIHGPQYAADFTDGSKAVL